MRLSADRIYQKCETFKFRERHNGLFVGFAPLKDPKIAVAGIGEHVCHGSSQVGPIVRAVIKTYLENHFPDQYGAKAIAERLKSQGKSTQVPVPPPRVAEEEDIIISDDVIPTNRTGAPAAPALPPAESPAEETSTEKETEDE